jgi:hypothetical protein
MTAYDRVLALTTASPPDDVQYRVLKNRSRGTDIFGATMYYQKYSYIDGELSPVNDIDNLQNHFKEEEDMFTL